MERLDHFNIGFRTANVIAELKKPNPNKYIINDGLKILTNSIKVLTLEENNILNKELEPYRKIFLYSSSEFYSVRFIEKIQKNLNSAEISKKTLEKISSCQKIDQINKHDLETTQNFLDAIYKECNSIIKYWSAIC
ncbi:MAG: hypothetical protein WC812_00890 [Candidatus Pacearchaeota archaeon]|jgi:hypothetical protein